MKRALISVVLMTWTTLAYAETKIVVLPIQASGTKVDAKTAQLITDRLTTELGKRADLKVMGTAEIQNLVTLEQQKQLMSCSDNSCLAELGNAMGADLIVSGTLGDLGNIRQLL